MQFGPRAARKSTRVSSSVFLEQQRGIQVASAEEFGVPNTSYPVISFSDAPQVCYNSIFSYQTLHKSTSDHPSPQSFLEDAHPPLDLPASPAPSLPNPYAMALRRNQTISSVVTSTPTSGSTEFPPRPRPKLSLTLSLPDSKPSVSITTIAINDEDTVLPNPYQPQALQANAQSYFSPHTPAAGLHPPTNPPVQAGATSGLGADLSSAFGVSYFSPHTPATTGLLSSLGTGNTTTTTVGTGPLGAKRERHGEQAGAAGSVSGLLAPPPTAAVGSYWSPHTPDEGLERAIEEAHSGTVLTAATDGHSAGPSSTSHRDSSPHSSTEDDPDVTTSDSSARTGNAGPIPTKSSKPQLKLQTWDLERMREEKKRQETTAVRRQGSRDKDARNRERKGRERTRQKEAEMTALVTEATKGETAPLRLLKPGSGPVARPPQQIIGSTNTVGARAKREPGPHPVALRPGSQYFQGIPAPPPLEPQSHAIINSLKASATQGNGIGADLTQHRHSTALNITWDLTPPLPLTLHNPYASPNPHSNPARDWSAHGRTLTEPNVPSLSTLAGGGGTQWVESGTTKERKRFGFFRNAGAAASDTNLVGLAASSPPAPGLRKPMDDKEANGLKENRKSAFYSRGVNASFEALVGWGGKPFSQSPTTVNTHGHGHEPAQPGRKGEKDEKTAYPVPAPLPATAHPRPYSQSQATLFATLPRTDNRRQYAPPPHAPLSNAQRYPAPSYPPGERGPSFEDFGVEIGRVGRNKTHTPPPGAADVQHVKKGHTKNSSSSGVSGLRKMFGFGKKDKDKDKQKWI